ncbi:MAG TPA: formate dehydrogenase subunit delta [Steroidobacteraceae bacterium]|jgi:formate dehydrogenase subunit delta|nr:formate dehydrogenase subunit delta [Steroidobacteraceae bacterium]
MNVQRLVAMANDIANFFGSDPDPTSAADQVANHLKKFWEPRMREEIRRHVSAGGTGLSSIALQAVKKLA